MATRITPDDLHELLRSATPHAVLDVRERGAFETGHIFRATSLPRRLLEFRLPELITAPRTPIALYDGGDGLAELAATSVEAMGYADVRVLAGGLPGWRASSRRVVQGLNVPSKVFGERMLHEMKTPQITPAELDARIAARTDMVIVDTRTPEEYRRGCIPGARNVPGGELVLRIGELVQRPDQPIVVHCGGRTRSYIGTETLRRMKLPNPIVALENGTMGWQLAGLELERGATRWAPDVSAESRTAAAAIATRVAGEDAVRFVTPADVVAMSANRRDTNVQVFDVRTSEEYAGEHVAGASWAPGGQLVQATDDYIAVAAAQIVLVCDGSGRSVMTAAWLGRMGLPNVAVLAGGLPAWIDARGDVERGHPSPVPFGYDDARATVHALDPALLARQLAADGGPLLIDVGPSDAYGRGHVPGAVWLCPSRLERTVVAVVPDKGRSVVVTCADGVASTLAAARLARLGYHAEVLDGGVRAWEASGQPTERGTRHLGDEPDDVVAKPYDRGRAAMEAYLRWEEALDLEGWSPIDLLGGARKAGA